jgi:hypothetical protein
LTKGYARKRIASMSATDYDRLKKAADEDHRLNLEAIERVRRMEQALAGRTPSPSASPNGAAESHVTPPKPKGPRPAKPGGGKVISAVRKTLSTLDDEFTRSMIQERLGAMHPKVIVKPGSLKAALNRMVETGEIEVVVRGTGRTLAKYRRGPNYSGGS